ncbi:MAG: hypothetical protein ACKOWF_09295 [Chloroflexota bacterium]
MLRPRRSFRNSFGCRFDAASRPRRIELEGPIFPGEDPGVLRRLDLTRFDEPVTIEPPAAGTPTRSA